MKRHVVNLKKLSPRERGEYRVAGRGAIRSCARPYIDPLPPSGYSPCSQGESRVYCRFQAVLSTLLLILMAVGPAWAQDGSGAAANYHSGNKLRLSFSNDGRIDVARGELPMEWPIGTGREYLNFAFPVVAVEQAGARQVAAFTPDAENVTAVFPL